MLWQENGLWYRYTKLCREAVIEKLVVGRPPKGIVDYICPLERHAFEHCAVIRNLVRDTIDDNVILFFFIQPNAADRDHFCNDRTAAVLIDTLDQRFRKSNFASGQYSNSFHIFIIPLLIKISENGTYFEILDCN